MNRTQQLLVYGDINLLVATLLP